jgi:hypothetical protein
MDITTAPHPALAGWGAVLTPPRTFPLSLVAWPYPNSPLTFAL